MVWLIYRSYICMGMKLHPLEWAVEKVWNGTLTKFKLVVKAFQEKAILCFICTDKDIDLNQCIAQLLSQKRNLSFLSSKWFTTNMSYKISTVSDYTILAVRFTRLFLLVWPEGRFAHRASIYNFYRSMLQQLPQKPHYIFRHFDFLLSCSIQGVTV